MANIIELQGIAVNGNRMEYIYSVSDSLRVYFYEQKTFFVEYDFDLTGIPEAVLAIPFLGAILPLAFLMDAQVKVRELDRDFCGCIAEVRNAFQKMYPGLPFGGIVRAENLVQAQRKVGGPLLLFSGGIDATCSLIENLGKRPALMSVWGADVKIDDENGWNQVENAVSDVAKTNHLSFHPVKSSFREVLVSYKITEMLQTRDKDLEYWHDFQHGVALLSLGAPICEAKGYSAEYIASSFPKKYPDIRCASHPSIDESVTFAGVKVVHDGQDFSRQDKVDRIVAYRKQTDRPVKLRVCWSIEGGENCGICEKCIRSATALIVSGENPEDYGIPFSGKNEQEAIRVLKYCDSISVSWKETLDRLAAMQPGTLAGIGDLHMESWEIKGARMINPHPLKKGLSFRERIKLRAKSSAAISSLYYELRENKRLKEAISVCEKKYRGVSDKPKLILMNTPIHSNIGDSAIAVAEIDFFREHLPEFELIEVDGEDLRKNFPIWKMLIAPEDIILLHGGGYLGSLWMKEENITTSVLAEFTRNQIIILPQTMYYQDTDEGKAAFARAQTVYSMHKTRLAVFLRDQNSYDFFRKEFSYVKNAFLVPDMVLSAKAVDALKNVAQNVERRGILLCMREDGEKCRHEDVIHRVIDFAAQTRLNVKTTSMSALQQIFAGKRAAVIESKLKEFASAQMVVTDRLHAMLFCVLTGTPCLAIDNISGKVRGSFSFVKDLPYLIFSNGEDLGEKLEQLITIASNGYEYKGSGLEKQYESIVDCVRNMYKAATAKGQPEDE